jgi:hypothetical protein
LNVKNNLKRQSSVNLKAAKKKQVKMLNLHRKYFKDFKLLNVILNQF